MCLVEPPPRAATIRLALPPDAYRTVQTSTLSPSPVAVGVPSFVTTDHPTRIALVGSNGARKMPLELRGINWFGFEGTGGVVDGLWEHSSAYFLELCAQLGINAIRIPLAVDTILLNPPPTTSVWKDAEMAKAPRSLDALTIIIRRAAASGILILLDMHRLVAAIWPDPHGLWYSDLVPESAVHAAWVVLARRFCAEWNVFGVSDQWDPITPKSDPNRRMRSTRTGVRDPTRSEGRDPNQSNRLRTATA
jgi:hypothetical protein